AGAGAAGDCPIATAAPPVWLPAPSGDLNAWREVAQPVIAEAHAIEGAVICVPGCGLLQIVEEAARGAARLDRAVALVTGGAGAIGPGICRALVQAGVRVAAADLSRDGASALAAQYAADFPGRILPLAMDVTDGASVAQGFAQAARAWGGVDIVVVN